MAVSRYCEYCGRAIIPRSAHTVKQYYCSPECRKAAHAGPSDGDRRNARHTPTVIKRNKKLSADAMEAKIAKISYGKLMARRAQG